MKKDLSELRMTAETATPGPWECVEGDEAFGVRSSFGSLTWDDHSGEVFKKEDAEFIATFDPSTVLALLSRLEQAEQAVARVEKALAEESGQEDRGNEVIDHEAIREALDGDGRD